jgi:MYXO-CTERM domain-containing protein
MATDESSHPGSVFRLQYCYIHDAIGNSNVKTRSERNEIYYNWLEAPGFHDMDLYGIDPDDNPDVSEGTAREDSDVVGNVVICSPGYSCARIGGDGTGNSRGRFRFVNNTLILTGGGDAVRTFQEVETLEMYNNVIYNQSTGSMTRVLNDADGSWVHGSRTVIGSNNFIVTGAIEVPTQLTGTISGTDPGFGNAAAFDFGPAAGSVLLNAGAASTPTLSSYPFSNPTFPPAYLPPLRTAPVAGSPSARAVNGVIDVGAMEGGAPASLAITTTSLPAGTVGVAYSQALHAAGGTTPYAWSIALGSLPSGLSLDPSTGVIRGTPTSAGGAGVTVLVTDSHNPAQTDDQVLSIAVSDRIDAGTGFDAGRPLGPDAGAPEDDAGTVIGLDASLPQPGQDATPALDSGGMVATDTDPFSGIQSGCGCQSGPFDPLLASLAILLAGFSIRRR